MKNKNRLKLANKTQKRIQANRPWNSKIKEAQKIERLLSKPKQ